MDFSNSARRPRIEFIGLGPMNGVSKAYEASIVAHLDWVVAEFDSLWSERAEGKPLEIVVNFVDKDERSTVKVVNRQERCFTSIRRTPKSTQVPNAVELARQDVVDWLESVRKRFGLEQWPELAPLGTIAKSVSDYQVPERD